MMDDGKVTDFAAAKAKMEAKGPNQYAIACARELLKKCESGEVVGMLCLVCSADRCFSGVASGAINYGDVLVMFEDWKADQQARRQRDR